MTVVGPINSGKSTLSRMLLSWWAKQGWKPTFVVSEISFESRSNSREKIISQRRIVQAFLIFLLHCNLQVICHKLQKMKGKKVKWQQIQDLRKLHNRMGLFFSRSLITSVLLLHMSRVSQSFHYAGLFLTLWVPLVILECPISLVSYMPFIFWPKCVSLPNSPRTTLSSRLRWRYNVLRVSSGSHAHVASL